MRATKASAGPEKSGSSHGAMRLEPPVMTGTERNNLRKSYRAFPFPTAAFLSLRCYRHVTLLWRLDGSIFRKMPAPDLIRGGYRFPQKMRPTKPMTWNYAVGFAFVAAGAFFVFRGPL
jgi:hypothetical protein